MINVSETMSAASPRLELAKLMSLARPMIRFVVALSMLLSAVAALMMTLTLIQSLNQRARELSLLRFLGATRLDLVLTSLTEALILGHVTFVTGLGLAFIGQVAIRAGLAGYGLDLAASLPPLNLVWLYLAMLGVAALGAVFPAARLYFTRDDEGFRA